MIEELKMLRDVMARAYCKRVNIKARGLHLLSNDTVQHQTNKTRVTAYLDGWDACEAICKKEIDSLRSQLTAIKNDLTAFVRTGTEE